MKLPCSHEDLAELHVHIIFPLLSCKSIAVFSRFKIQSQWSTDENDGVVFGNPGERAQISYIVSWHFVYLCMDDMKPALETVPVVFEPTCSTILSSDGFSVHILGLHRFQPL